MCCCLAILHLWCIANFGRKPTFEKFLQISPVVNFYRVFSSELTFENIYLSERQLLLFRARVCERELVEYFQKSEFLKRQNFSKVSSRLNNVLCKPTIQCAMYSHDRVKRLFRMPFLTHIFSKDRISRKSARDSTTCCVNPRSSVLCTVTNKLNDFWECLF